MERIQRSALVPHRPEQLFELVNDVAAYPEFVPWCTRAEVLSATDEEVVAALTLGKGPVSERLVTRNLLHFPERIELRLEEGPFRYLQGRWRFKPVGDAGSRVELELEFELKHPIWGRMFGALFARVANSLVDSFCARARRLYGMSDGADAPRS